MKAITLTPDQQTAAASLRATSISAHEAVKSAQKAAITADQALKAYLVSVTNMSHNRVTLTDDGITVIVQ